jgi:hypothetical protein
VRVKISSYYVIKSSQNLRTDTDSKPLRSEWFRKYIAVVLNLYDRLSLPVPRQPHCRSRQNRNQDSTSAENVPHSPALPIRLIRSGCIDGVFHTDYQLRYSLDQILPGSRKKPGLIMRSGFNSFSYDVLPESSVF